MDFITKLPTSHGRSTMLVVVDRLSIGIHFIPLKSPFKCFQKRSWVPQNSVIK